jgi:hypothetical protein
MGFFSFSALEYPSLKSVHTGPVTLWAAAESDSFDLLQTQSIIITVKAAKKIFLLHSFIVSPVRKFKVFLKCPGFKLRQGVFLLTEDAPVFNCLDQEELIHGYSFFIVSQ